MVLRLFANEYINSYSDVLKKRKTKIINNNNDNSNISPINIIQGKTSYKCINDSTYNYNCRNYVLYPYGLYKNENYVCNNCIDIHNKNVTI